VREVWTDAVKSIATATKGQPVQEQQYGSNIDSVPIEHNTPAPMGSGVATGSEMKGKRSRAKD
jgi:hypothetical protein